MERLTDKRMKGEGFISVDPKEYKAFIKNEKPTGKQIYQRLLEIEDILGDDYDLDRLKELVEAGRGGRCVVLPCKIGDTIYDISRAEIKESKVVSISFSASELPYRVSICAENYNYAVTIDIEMNDFIEIDDFGKIVFFTREEAEEALKERGN